MIINASIQVVPLGLEKSDSYPLIDGIISDIQNSGMKCIVGAFETVLEGPYEQVQNLIRNLQDKCFKNKECQFLVYTKLQFCGGKDILLEDKKLDR